MSRISPAAQLEKIRAAKIKLEKEEKRLMTRTHDKVLAQIARLVESSGVSLAQITEALGGKKGKGRPAKSASAKAPKARRSTAGRKVAPKYRNPDNANQTWTGRGRTPAWVQALEAAGQLASAEINAA